jgi:integrase
METFRLDISDTYVHTFRKTCGAHMLQNKVPISYVSKFLGHSSIAVTEKCYVGLSNANLEEAANSLLKMETLMETFTSGRHLTNIISAA